MNLLLSVSRDWVPSWADISGVQRYGVTFSELSDTVEIATSRWADVSDLICEVNGASSLAILL